MNRIIINNKTDLTDLDAINIVQSVIRAGRISNYGKQYCYLSTWDDNGKEYQITTDLRKKSDSFTIIEVKK
jgi:hypothetical protein